MAVFNHHVEPLFPYISHTASLSPESCLFAQCTNIAALLILCCVYVKYLQVKEFPEMSSGIGVSHSLNVSSLVIGILSCIGFDIVGNFQESNILEVHMLGAITCFGAGTLYFALQTWISYKLPEFTSKRLLITRIIIVSVCTLLTFTTLICGVISYILYEGKKEIEEYMKWRPEDGGWELHLVSTFSQWILSVLYCIFFLSFVTDFYEINIHTPFITFKEHAETSL